MGPDGPATADSSLRVPRPRAWQQALPWLITLACFAFLFRRVNAAAVREGAN